MGSSLCASSSWKGSDWVFQMHIIHLHFASHTHKLYTAVFTCIVFFSCWIVLINMSISSKHDTHVQQPWWSSNLGPGSAWILKVGDMTQESWRRKINVEQPIVTWGWWNQLEIWNHPNVGSKHLTLSSTQAHHSVKSERCWWMFQHPSHAPAGASSNPLFI